MAQRTWFLPPHFSFLPDSHLAIGTVIPHPSKPTRTLAVLSSGGEIKVPEITSITEKSHHHGDVHKGSLGGRLFAKVGDLLSLSQSANFSHKKIKSLGEVDLEVRCYKTGLSTEALKQVVELPQVKQHINTFLFGKRPAYIITGLRVAKNSFDVLYETDSVESAYAQVSGTATADGPVRIGGAVRGNREETKIDGFKTAPGIVYAYQLHAIRMKGKDNVSTELFSHRTGFLTGEGEGEDREEEQEMEYIEVSKDVMEKDLEVIVDSFSYEIGNNEVCVAFEGMDWSFPHLLDGKKQDGE